jgi:excisionase family DNA binding protein
MNHYSAHVETDLRKTPADVDSLLEQLEQFHAALGMSPAGLFSVQMTVTGETLPQAAVVATAVVEAVVGAPVVSIEIMTETEFNRREGFDDVDDLVSVPEAAELLGVSRQAVGQRIRSGSLPGQRRGRDWMLPRKAVEAAAARKAATS